MKNSHKIILAHLLFWSIDILTDFVFHHIENWTYCYWQSTYIIVFYFIYFILTPRIVKQPNVKSIGIWFIVCLFLFFIVLNIRDAVGIYLFFYGGSLDDFQFIIDFEYLVGYLYFAPFILGIRLYHNWLLNIDENKGLESKKAAAELNSYKNRIDLPSINKTLVRMKSMASQDVSSVQESIIELSNILRYNIYESNKEKVTLGEELEIVKSQISLNNELYNNDLQLSFSKEWNHVLIEPGVMIKAIIEFLRINPTGGDMKLVVIENQLYLSIEDSKDRLILLKEKLQKYIPQLMSISKDQTNLQLQLATL